MRPDYILMLNNTLKLFPTNPDLPSGAHQDIKCGLCGNIFNATPKSKVQAHKTYKIQGCPKCTVAASTSDAKAATQATMTKMGYVWSSEYLGHKKPLTVMNTKCGCGRYWTTTPERILSGRSFCRPCNDDRKRNRFNELNEVRRKRFDGSYDTYRATVRRLTEQTYKNNLQLLNPDGHVRALSGTHNGYHLDHIVPLVIAYRVGIPPEECAAVYNLRMLQWQKNANKWSKPPSSIPQPLIKYFGNKNVLTDKLIQFMQSNGIKFTDTRSESDLDCDFTIGGTLAIKVVDFDSHVDKNLKTKTYLSVLRGKLYTKFKKVLIIFQNEILDAGLWDIVQSRILNAVNHTSITKVFARKTQLRKIDSKLHTKFMDSNHIQGSCASTHRYGLYFGDLLVAVMSFSKPRVIMNNSKRVDSYEITRYATLRGYNVVGGASKLLSAFIKDLGPDVKIFSFADLRWGDGTLYSSLGLNYVSTSRPNYWYIVDEQPVHRYRYAKHNLKKMFPETFAVDKTEYQIMVENGFDRVWDCGSKLFQNY